MKSAKKWCEFYGVKVRDGVAILFKAVSDNFKSLYGTSYAPGQMPVAKDWDGGERECGGGLHFSPHPLMALRFNRWARRFVACPVKVSEIVMHPGGALPEMIKAPRVSAPCWECDIHGKRLQRKGKVKQSCK